MDRMVPKPAVWRSRVVTANLGVIYEVSAEGRAVLQAYREMCGPMLRWSE